MLIWHLLLYYPYPCYETSSKSQIAITAPFTRAAPYADWYSAICIVYHHVFIGGGTCIYMAKHSSHTSSTSNDDGIYTKWICLTNYKAGECAQTWIVFCTAWISFVSLRTTYRWASRAVWHWLSTVARYRHEWINTLQKHSLQLI